MGFGYRKFLLLSGRHISLVKVQISSFKMQQGCKHMIFFLENCSL
jgi:hypothetical protein